MELWNFIHDSLGLHLWTFLAYVIIAVMVLVALVHTIMQKKRDRKYEEELARLSSPSQERGPELSDSGKGKVEEL